MKEARKNKSDFFQKSADTHPLLRIKRTFGQRAADKLSVFCGSWRFIILLLCFMAVWIFLNILMLILRWDPYPFILLNLILSCLAALQAPIILMSQNRQAQKDRLTATYDYSVDKKAEKGIQKIQYDLDEIKTMLRKRR